MELIKRSTRLEEIMPLIREELNNDRSVRIHPKGTSMLPMLREGRDSVVLSKIPESPRKYDVILYQRDNGQYVLHRLVRTDETYDFLGDNQFVIEEGVEYRQMIGRVSSFYRGDKQKSIDSFGYRLYCRFWFHSRGLRRFWRRGIGWIKRHTNKK